MEALSRPGYINLVLQREPGSAARGSGTGHRELELHHPSENSGDRIRQRQ